MGHTITVLRGDGIGPEISDATVRVLDALDCGFDYDYQLAGLAALDAGKDLLPQETLDSIEATDATLKGPLTTPVGKGFSSINVALRRHFDLYGNLRPAVSFPGINSRYANVDIITVRENTEGAYGSEGQTISEDGTRAESMMIITRSGSERIVRFAFEEARKRGRKRVTAVHKANILKTTSGLFLDIAREIAQDYPEIEFDDLIVDNCCMQLVINPYRFDVMVTTNLFGDILSDLCAGLVGGLGLAPGANIGDNAAIFEAVHGSAPDIAGKGIANPSALMLAAALMLDHLGMSERANRLRGAIKEAISESDHLTADVGGQSTTRAYTDALLKRMGA